VVGSKNGGFIGVYEIERDFSVNHIDTFKVDPNSIAVDSLSISFDKTYLVLAAEIQEESLPAIYMQEEGAESDMSRLEIY